jgi:hypothetical protein
MLVGNTQRIEKKMIMTGLEILEKRSKIGWVAIAAKLNHQRK